MNLKELKEVFRMVEKTDFTEVEIVQNDLRIRIERGKASAAPAFMGHSPMQMESRLQHGGLETSDAVTHAAISKKESVAAEEKPGFFVTSPFVGTFYRSPSPDADAYVEIGQVVKKGQVLCIVEAMKLMNEIESEYDGKIAEIYAQNAQPVEFSHKLFRIEPL